MENHFKALQKIVGMGNIFADSPHLNAYSFDSTRLESLPQFVIFPRNEQEVSEILRYANLHRIPVTPRGAGSGMSGGSINSGIILATQKHLNEVLNIDPRNLCVSVQPGIINAHLNEILKPHGLFFAPDPASSGFSTIGGNIAENSGGMNALRYGTCKDNILSLRAVLGNGEVIQIGHKTYKDVAGYNLLSLMCGSEGSLGIITELTLKLHPIQRFTRSVILCFQSIQDLTEASYAILSSGITPSAMEFLDTLTINALNQKFNIYPSSARAILIVRLASFSQSNIQEEIREIQKICPQSIDFAQAENQAEEEKIWLGRKNASQALFVYGIKKLNEDITVPRNQVGSFLQQTEKIGGKYGFHIPCFGHIGDGNIHTNVMLKNLNDIKRGQEAVRELFEIALSLGGTLSGEHGIGVTKAPFMPMAFSEIHLELFKSIKKVFDPNHILNPNKMGF